MFAGSGARLEGHVASIVESQRSVLRRSRFVCTAGQKGIPPHEPSLNSLEGGYIREDVQENYRCHYGGY